MKIYLNGSSKCILTFMFAVVSLFSIGQESEDKAYLKVRVIGLKKTKPFFKIDSTMYRITDTVLLVSKGKHSIQIWSPTYNYIDSTIIVKKSDTTKYTFGLKHTKEYDAYKWNYTEYKRKSNQRYLISPMFVGMALGVAVYSNSTAKKHYNSALQEKYNYSISGSQSTMDQYESNFNDYHKKYKIMKSVEYGMYGVSALLVANYVRLIIKQKKVPVPVYKEKVIFSKIDLSPYRDIVDNKWGLNMKIKF